MFSWDISGEDGRCGTIGDFVCDDIDSSMPGDTNLEVKDN